MIDRWFQRFLFNVFGQTAAKAIYGTVISIIAFFKKIALFLSLPFKFVQFWIESYKEQTQGNQDQRAD